MAKFNYRDYDAYYVMHCSTAEEAETFFNYLDKEGLTWRNGERYPDSARWSPEDSCYRFIAGTRGSLQTYRNAKGLLGREATILYFDDFDWGEDESFDIEIPFETILQGVTMSKMRGRYDG